MQKQIKWRGQVNNQILKPNTETDDQPIKVDWKTLCADIKKDKFKCRLTLGDCLDLLPKVKSKSIDLICADMPYGTTRCKWDSIIDFP